VHHGQKTTFKNYSQIAISLRAVTPYSYEQVINRNVLMADMEPGLP